MGWNAYLFLAILINYLGLASFLCVYGGIYSFCTKYSRMCPQPGFSLVPRAEMLVCCHCGGWVFGAALILTGDNCGLAFCVCRDGPA